jgi:hypothetical protein
VGLERASPAFVFFDTLKSARGVGFVHRREQAHERRPCIIAEPRLEGRDPRRGTSKAERGSAGERWVTPLRRERTFQVHKSLSYATLD